MKKGERGREGSKTPFGLQTLNICYLNFGIFLTTKNDTFDEHENVFVSDDDENDERESDATFTRLSSRSTKPYYFRSRFSKQDHYSRTNTT